MTPRQLRDAANGPWEEAKSRCPHCLGAGYTYTFVIDERGPRPEWDRCEPCKGTGQRLSA